MWFARTNSWKDLHQVMFLHSVVLVVRMLPVGGHDHQMGLVVVEYQLVPIHVLGYLCVLPVQININKEGI